MIVLLNQYKNARKELSGMLAELLPKENKLEERISDTRNKEQRRLLIEELTKLRIDKSHINSMIDSTTYIIEWIKKGGNPEEMRGVNIRDAYRIKYLSNMDILPDLTEQIERKPLELTEDKKRIIIKFFESLSDRERDCFILHVTQNMSLSEVGEQLGINKPSVQTYINRAKEKAEMVKRLY